MILSNLSKNKKRLILFLILVALFSPVLFLVEDEGDLITEIRGIYYDTNKIIADSSAETKICLDFEEDQWKAVSVDSEKYFYYCALIFRIKNKINKIEITSVSGAGHWKNVREFYFYSNRKTAFIYEEHSTEQVSDIRTTDSVNNTPLNFEYRNYFDYNGNKFKRLKKAIDDNGKVLDAENYVYLGMKRYTDYKKLSDFPFYKLLIK